MSARVIIYQHSKNWDSKASPLIPMSMTKVWHSGMARSPYWKWSRVMRHLPIAANIAPSIFFNKIITLPTLYGSIPKNLPRSSAIFYRIAKPDVWNSDQAAFSISHYKPRQRQAHQPITVMRGRLAIMIDMSLESGWATLTAVL